MKNFSEGEKQSLCENCDKLVGQRKKSQLI